MSKAAFLILFLCIPGIVHANTIPYDVKRFMVKRDICDNLRKRVDFFETQHVLDFLNRVSKACDLTDMKLQALKERYQNNKVVLDVLSKYDDSIVDINKLND